MSLPMSGSRKDTANTYSDFSVLDVVKRQIKDCIRKDGRSRVIYEDGMESNILFRTIGKNA